ncbi:MAG: elongation factor G, partial [Deltaproteobacteria bacterium]|nr:elongation factor G [Deltaproteobacteria bacterium]
TLGEALLFASKTTTRRGLVEEGNTVLDFEPEEHKRVASVQASLAHLEWKKNKVNLLDTPGDPTFFAETQNCIAVADALVTVVSAPDGVDPQTVKVFKAGEGMARAIVLNKLGRERADFDKALAEVKDKLIAGAVPVTLPIGKEDKFRGVIDLLNMKAHIYTPASQNPPAVEDVPADLSEAAKAARSALLEEIAANDEALMERYLEAGELSADEARAGLRKAILAGSLVPVFATDGAHNMGTHELLDLVADSFPSPELGRKVMAKSADGQEVEAPRDPNGPLAALVFKTFVDQHTGKISMFRIFSGRASKDATVQNTTRRSSERLAGLLALAGKKIEQIDEAAMGDIVAVAKLKDTLTGDTLCGGNLNHQFKLPQPPLPQISFRLIPKNKGDEDKISQAIARLRDEDPTLVLGHDEITKELMLSGTGVSHIDVAVEKMERKYGVRVDRAPPLVPYRETLVKAVQNIEGKHKKQSGGRGQFGVCYINVRPLPRGGGYSFVNSIFGVSIPKQYIPAVDKGIQEALVRGVLAGYPMVDIEVERVDGKYHDVDSSEMAFKIAGSKGFQAASKQSGVTILEPIMIVEVEVPEENMGDVLGDLNSRRGRVMGMETEGGVSRIKAQVPMAEMLTYAPDLKSMTQGRGWFSMSQSHYDPVPPHLLDKVVAASPNRPQAAAED